MELHKPSTPSIPRTATGLPLPTEHAAALDDWQRLWQPLWQLSSPATHSFSSVGQRQLQQQQQELLEMELSVVNAIQQVISDPLRAPRLVISSETFANSPAGLLQAMGVQQTAAASMSAGPDSARTAPHGWGGGSRAEYSLLPPHQQIIQVDDEGMQVDLMDFFQLMDTDNDASHSNTTSTATASSPPALETSSPSAQGTSEGAPQSSAAVAATRAAIGSGSPSLVEVTLTLRNAALLLHPGNAMDPGIMRQVNKLLKQCLDESCLLDEELKLDILASLVLFCGCYRMV